MFRIFIFFLLAFFSCQAFAQDTLNVTDKTGRKQGVWRKKNSAGQLVYEGHFKDGLPLGEFRYYYPDGKLKTVSVISNQGKRAVTTSWFPNGKKMATGIYRDEKKDSTWQFFSESNGTLVSEENYKDGLTDGISKVFYPDGQLSEIHHLRSGVKDGPWEQYYLDGKIKLRATYKAGEKDGLFKTFYSSGQVMMAGQYISGLQDGTWMYYGEMGAVTKKEIYNKGILVKLVGGAK